MTEQAEDLGYVLYEKADCAGFFRRLVATAVDGGVLLVGLTLALAVHLALWPGRRPGHVFAVFFAASYVYLTALKRSRLRTPGYWLTGLRIVNLRGERPSMALMTLRLLWWILGPLNPVIDLFFMTHEEQRQTLRDKLFGAYVIRRDATPAGNGRRVISRWGFMGMTLLLPEVCPAERGAPAGDGGAA